MARPPLQCGIGSTWRVRGSSEPIIRCVTRFGDLRARKCEARHARPIERQDQVHEHSRTPHRPPPPCRRLALTLVGCGEGASEDAKDSHPDRAKVRMPSTEVCNAPALRSASVAPARHLRRWRTTSRHCVGVDYPSDRGAPGLDDATVRRKTPSEAAACAPPNARAPTGRPRRQRRGIRSRLRTAAADRSRSRGTGARGTRSSRGRPASARPSRGGWRGCRGDASRR